MANYWQDIAIFKKNKQYKNSIKTEVQRFFASTDTPLRTKPAAKPRLANGRVACAAG
jgi:hypothetical protein